MGVGSTLRARRRGAARGARCVNALLLQRGGWGTSNGYKQVGRCEASSAVVVGGACVQWGCRGALAAGMPHATLG